MSLRFRKHVRLPDHDYLQGAYFVTMCTWWRRQVFGSIVGAGADARMELTDIGRIVDECWRAIPEHFPHAQLHEMQIMPDHLHAIVVLNNARDNGIRSGDPLGRDYDTVDKRGRMANGPARGSLGAIIGSFKSETTRRANRLNGTLGRSLWQPNYHERVIREQTGEIWRIAQYIAENPMKWR